MTKIQIGKPSKYYKGNLGDLVKENPLHQEAVNSMPAGEIKLWIDSRYSIGYCSPYKIDCFGFPIGFIAPGVADNILDPNDPFAIAYQNGSPQFRERFVGTLGTALEEKIQELEQRTNGQKPDDKKAWYISYSFDFIREINLSSLKNLVQRVIAPKFDFEYTRPHPYTEEDKRNLSKEAFQLLASLSRN